MIQETLNTTINLEIMVYILQLFNCFQKLPHCAMRRQHHLDMRTNDKNCSSTRESTIVNSFAGSKTTSCKN